MRRREFITLLGGAAVSPLAGRALTAIDKESVRNALIAAGWPHRANVAEANLPALTFLVFLLDLYLAIVFAPIAALMAELFPARLRYTSTSLPIHLGAGWIGRFLPSASPHSTSTSATSTPDSGILSPAWRSLPRSALPCRKRTKASL
jgi:hypothetical protein